MSIPSQFVMALIGALVLVLPFGLVVSPVLRCYGFYGVGIFFAIMICGNTFEATASTDLAVLRGAAPILAGLIEGQAYKWVKDKGVER